MANPLKKHPELITDTVFLIGNGISRKNFDLNTLKGKGTIIGCNALYRDFKPDILICQDSKMAKELNDNKYSGLILSNKGIAVRNSNMIVWKPGNARTSGVLGLKFIKQIIKPSRCYIFGMDGYSGNVYSGTLNYNREPYRQHKVTAQYAEIVKNTLIEFINVNIIDSWGIFDTFNYRCINYEQFNRECSSAW